VSPLRLIIGLLFLVAVILAFLVLRPGYGQLSGSVRDLDGNPLQADVFVTGLTSSVKTDADGDFQIENIPSGQQSLVITYGDQVFTLQLEIPKQGTFNIGQIQVDTGA
jgi:hypothetical protein